MAQRAVTQAHECGVEVRPCPHVECRHHLRQGEHKAKWEHRQDCSETCSLDVADRGPLGLVEVGRLIGVDRSRVQQLEVRALKKLAQDPKARELFGAARGHEDERPPLLETLVAQFTQSVRNHWT